MPTPSAAMATRPTSARPERRERMASSKRASASDASLVSTTRPEGPMATVGGSGGSGGSADIGVPPVPEDRPHQARAATVRSFPRQGGPSSGEGAISTASAPAAPFTRKGNRAGGAAQRGSTRQTRCLGGRSRSTRRHDWTSQFEASGSLREVGQVDARTPRASTSAFRPLELPTSAPLMEET